MLNKIHYSKPSITKHEINIIMDAAKYGWGEKCYEYILANNQFRCTQVYNVPEHMHDLLKMKFQMKQLKIFLSILRKIYVCY